MSGGLACKCLESKKPVNERNWLVNMYCCNVSAFNGYRSTPSDYSEIQCNTCNALWRSKAEYTHKLKRMNRRTIY